MHPRSPLRTVAFLVGAVVATAALTACAPDSSGAVGTATSGAARTTASASTAPAGSVDGTPVGSSSAVPEALRFTARGVGGGSVDLGQYAGRPIVFWFWAPG